MANMVKVGMGDYKISNRPDSLTTLGLGSCVGICIYDKISGIIGLAHIMLPQMPVSREGQNIAKFADIAIPTMVELMISNGAKKSHLVAKIAGGAQMFAFSNGNDLMKIGLRNIVATKAKLKELGIPLLSEDTGGSSGRTIEFSSETGELLIKTVGKPIKII